MTELLVIGYITKPHGLRGDVLVHLVTNRVEQRMRVGASFASDRGPLVVESCAPQGDRWRVHFRGVDDRNGAEALARVELRAEPLHEPGTLWVHELVGSRVVSVDGSEVGVVESVESNPASDLMVLDTGALVPLVFVVTVADRVVTIDPPPGLLELTDADDPDADNPDADNPDADNTDASDSAAD